MHAEMTSVQEDARDDQIEEHRSRADVPEPVDWTGTRTQRSSTPLRRPSLPRAMAIMKMAAAGPRHFDVQAAMKDERCRAADNDAGAICHSARGGSFPLVLVVGDMYDGAI